MDYDKWLESLDYCEILLARLIQLNDGTRAVNVYYRDGESVGQYIRMKNKILTVEQLLEAGLVYTKEEYNAKLA